MVLAGGLKMDRRAGGLWQLVNCNHSSEIPTETAQRNKTGRLLSTVAGLCARAGDNKPKRPQPNIYLTGTDQDMAVSCRSNLVTLEPLFRSLCNARSAVYRSRTFSM